MVRAKEEIVNSPYETVEKVYTCRLYIFYGHVS
jgi:hypothetical protein